ncbi:unnamed protein product [Brassica rapa]|uniref:Uncharacterized protein n=1 Tax=Brassica campestris TaxID=3711 RepID=A0A8D9DLE8_BRACM|nr:unnamed protein product [Brassica rapa]
MLDHFFQVGAVCAPVSCSVFFPPVVSGGLHIVEGGWLLSSPHSWFMWPRIVVFFGSPLRSCELLVVWRPTPLPSLYISAFQVCLLRSGL